MKKLVLILLALWLNSVSAIMAECLPEVQIGNTFLGIPAFSNVPYTETGNGCYQCVELSFRFSAEYHDGFGTVDNAANMWNILPASKGYTAVENDSSTSQPQVGDFIIWWGGSYGHVAIVSRVLGDQIEVFEQNINNAIAPYRFLPMSKNLNGKWYLDPGPRLSSYYVKGWLRYPGFSVVGRYNDGQTFHQKAIDCYNLHGGITGVGWSIEDGGGVFVHNWLPFSYQCQNFRNAQGQESIIMYGAPFTIQAYRISGLIWEHYRYGYNGHWGPDIRLPNGKKLGAPVSDEAYGIQYFENGLISVKLGVLPTKSDTQYQVITELRQSDGTLVDIYYAAGELSALTLVGQVTPENNNVLALTGGPDCDHYDFLADGTVVWQCPSALKSFVDSSLLPGTVKAYQAKAMALDNSVLAESNQITLAMPGVAGTFALTAEADGSTAANVHWIDTLHQTPFYGIYRDGVMVAKFYGCGTYRDFPLEPNHAYRYQASALTASGLVRGFSNAVSVTTPLPPEVPPPPPPFPATAEICLRSDGLAVCH